MALTDDEGEYFERLLDACAANPDKLSAWETSFMEDQRKRWEEYGHGIRLSPKQWGILNRIGEKVGL